ncbi:MAG: cytochrome b/b6 domain-containing protein [Wenzhouxiangellaceae bacterium]
MVGEMEERTYRPLHILFHWLTAVLVIGLFGLGLWMTELDYYHAWYHRAPYWHKVIGVLTALLLILRLLWRLLKPTPPPAATSERQRLLAQSLHAFFYGLILTLAVAGYLIATAKGKAVELPLGMQLPALVTLSPDWAERMGDWHRWLAYMLIVLASGHALMALKHHFIDGLPALRRMLGLSATPRS